METQEIETKKRVALHTLGCRLNMSETGSIAQGFTERGYEVVPFGEEADVVFVNTCTVTDQADSTCRNLIRRAHRSSPEGKIVVAGCYAQMDPQRISRMQGVDLVLGTQEKYKVFDYLEETQSEMIKVDKTNEFWGATTTASDFHTRAFLKIQDGCNYVCSFCIIPQARGRSRTITVEQAVLDAQKILGQGFKEIVLTGVNIGEYESTSGERLSDMVTNILNLEGLKRLRLSSVEPNTITDELLALFKSSSKFMPHFHIPMQSGHDRVLTSMRRRYSADYYRTVIGKIKGLFPEAGIGADVIVGYPGESEEEFMATYQMLQELPITHFHVFPYSKRKGTLASKMENQIPHATKKERVHRLLALGEEKLKRFAEEQVGKQHMVLFEKRNKSGAFEGHTPNYLRVEVESEAELHNQIVPVIITHAEAGKLRGSLLN